MKVREIFTESPAVCTPDTTLASAGWLMWENDCGFLPVIDDGKVISVITDRDICIGAATKYRPAAEIAVREVANGKLHACGPDDDLLDALRTMRTVRVRRLPVLDAEGRLLGVLSVNDVVRVAKTAKSAKKGDVTFDDVGLALREICEPWGSAAKAHKTEMLAATTH